MTSICHTGMEKDIDHRDHNDSDDALRLKKKQRSLEASARRRLKQQRHNLHGVGLRDPSLLPSHVGNLFIYNNRSNLVTKFLKKR